MKAEALTPRELFEGTVQYEVPAFQRPYVWNEEDQWEPLWQDVKRVAEGVVGAGTDPDDLEAVGGHFLGALVFKSKPPVAGDVARHSVIDGQQRTTTMQILLDAVQEAVKGLGYEDEAEALGELILNHANRFKGRPERFKLWPSRFDRPAFEYAMDHSGATVHEHPIVEAHRFFRTRVRSWLTGEVDEGESPVGNESARVRALADVMQSRLLVVAINLAGHDDDQVIFETLNDRGTPLLKADLIKNWVFQIGEKVGADVEKWPDRFWLDFDDSWWREEITQGRHMRSRIDIFLQYWLTMRTYSEVLTDQVFRTFMAYGADRMMSADAAEILLGELRRDADTFRNFAQLSTETVEGRFYSRVVESLELAATTPLLLWMLSENHAVPENQVSKALAALESWVIRRTLLRYTMKDVNKMMVAILGELEHADVSQAGEVVVDYLASQTSDSRSWPKDAEVIEAIPSIRMYGSVRQGRLRVVLQAIEHRLRTEMHEALDLPPKLELEHVMPQGWRTFWDADPALNVEAAYERDRIVNSLGNLTLVTKKLNGALSHRPWTDEEALEVAPKGMDAGLGKRSLLSRYSLLVLNKEIIEEHPDAWTEADIKRRSRRLAETLCKVWPDAESYVDPERSKAP